MSQTESKLRRVIGPAAIVGTALLLDPLVRVSDADGGSAFSRGLASWSGQAAEYGTVLLGLGSTWLFSGPETRQAVRRVARAAAVTSLVTRALKIYVGRARPSAWDTGRRFQPVQLESRYNSFPSGHTALAFALAQAIDDEIDSRPAEFGLYTLSALVGWSRVRQDKHWASDVAAGAITGIVVTRMLRDGHFFPNQPQLAFTPAGFSVMIPVGF
jgi:membrane-associated phospholipid phosphatase